jgi:hypothetical protein
MGTWRHSWIHDATLEEAKAKARTAVEEKVRKIYNTHNPHVTGQTFP